LQFQQLELDPSYFQIQDFSPREYIGGNKDFNWFRNEGFDYIVVSSGQYMRYFVEGQPAEKYRQYYLKLFEDAEQNGTLVLDLTTHPTQIPDFRIKVFSTRKVPQHAAFIPAIRDTDDETLQHVSQPGSVVALDPGYYSLELPKQRDPEYTAIVKNLKLNEIILQAPNSFSKEEPDRTVPFSIFPFKEASRFSLFARIHPIFGDDQPIQFNWTGLPDGVRLRRIKPRVDVLTIDITLAQKFSDNEPYLLLEKDTPFLLRCSLANHRNSSIAGYVEAFLSQVGEPLPWKDYEKASGVQDFFLEGKQTITIEIPMNTENLTGDHQLSYWIFIRPNDLPYSPQYGGWFNKVLRVNDPKLGLHPIYGIPIP